MTSTMKSGTAKKKKMVEIDPEEEERRKKEAAFQQELKTYGVSIKCFVILLFSALGSGMVIMMKPRSQCGCNARMNFVVSILR